MNKISLLLITKNESDKLEQWGREVSKIKTINEIVVIDSFSTDNTVKILQKLASKNLSVKVFKRHLANDFSAQRNFGVSKCQNDWIFFLDADEIPENNTINFLNHFDSIKKTNYSFKRDLYYMGQKIQYSQCFQDRPLRLFLKNSGQFKGTVHEIWQSQLPLTQTHCHITHYSFKKLADFIPKINFYSTLRAQELLKAGHKSNLLEIILYPLGKFISLFFFKLGFLDGLPGLILSLTFSLNSFLVRSKLWHWQQK